MQEELISAGLMNFIDYNFTSALDNFNKAVEKNSQCSTSLLYRGICHMKLGDYEKAISDLNKSQQINEQSGYELFYSRALAYLFNSEIVFAKNDFIKALSLADESQKDEVNKYLIKLE